MRMMKLALLFALSLVLQASAQTFQTATGTPLPSIPKAHVEGFVLDGVTGMPIADAVVLAPGTFSTLGPALGGVTMTTSTDIPKNLRTDREGHFAVEVDSGPITLNINKAGYRPASLEGRKLPNNSGIPLDLDPGQRLTSLTIKLFSQPVVTARVFEPRGEPMQDAEIQAFCYIYNEAGVRLRLNIATTKTNDLGDFRMDNLDPGDYYLEIRPPDPGGRSGSLLAPIFYPSTTDISRAETVAIAAGAKVELKSITAIPIHGGALKVKLDNQGDEPRGASTLSVFRDGENSAVRSHVIQKDLMTNILDLGRLVPGKYFVRARFSGVNSGTNEGRVTIDVGEGDTQINLPIVTLKPWNFAGEAVVESANGDARPVPGIQLAFFDVGPNSLTSNFRLMAPLTLVSQSDGSFPGRALVPSMPPYSFHVRVLNPPPGMYVSTVRGGHSTRELRADYGGTTHLTVVFGENAGTIEGIVADSKGAAVPVGNVVLLPDDPNEIHRLVMGNTTIDGRFRLQAGPGEYRLYAWRELIGAPYLNSEYMRRYGDKGVPVRVQLGEHTAIEVRPVED